MTKCERMTKPECRNNPYVLHVTSVIRASGFFCHSSFVIRHSSLATLALPLALTLLVSCSKPSARVATDEPADAVPITVAKVAMMPMDQSLDVWGTLHAKDEATLGAEVEGKVENTLVDFGDRVKAGQELAAIDTTIYEALARQAEANLAKAKAAATNAGLNLKRAQELRKNNIA